MLTLGEDRLRVQCKLEASTITVTFSSHVGASPLKAHEGIAITDSIFKNAERISILWVKGFKSIPFRSVSKT